MIPLLAQIGGSDMIHALVVLFVCGLILAILWWGGQYLPAPLQRGWQICIAVVGMLLVINFLLGLIGHPLVRF